MTTFTIAATGLSMNYMPQYIAEQQGFFEEQNLNICSYLPDPWTKGLDDLENGQADVVLGGMWLPMIYSQDIQKYTSVAKIASKCPLVILSRERLTGGFDWKNLEGKRVLVSGGDGAGHYLMTVGSAREGGADPSKIRFIHDFSTAMICDLFEKGFGDFIVVQPDVAHSMIDRQVGFNFCDLTRKGSNIPWSVYYGLPETVESNLDGFEKFAVGLQKGTSYLLENGGEACRSIIKKNWPAISVDDGIKTIDMFIKEGMWRSTINIEYQEVDRWQDYLILGDVLDRKIAYEQLVDNRPYLYSKNKLSL